VTAPPRTLRPPLRGPRRLLTILVLIYRQMIGSIEKCQSLAPEAIAKDKQVSMSGRVNFTSLGKQYSLTTLTEGRYKQGAVTRI
jgi:hypothetical protein